MPSLALDLRHFGIPSRPIGGHWLTGNEDNTKVVKFSIGGEKLAIDFSDHCKSEFYAEGIGWIPTDCTPQRQAKDFNAQARQARFLAGKRGWDKDFVHACVQSFGCDDAMLLLGGNGMPGILTPNGFDVMSREHESTEINVAEGRFMEALEKEMETYPAMPVCSPAAMFCA